MDNGAHFHRCDFQVHTPRDINWHGHRPVADDERSDYAREFIRACREKGLHAVAITDHHDTAFYRYIRNAAGDELGADGRPVDENDRIVVFPGMELTFGVGCQAILLFDADFPLEFLPQVAPVLSITPNHAHEAVHAQVQRLDHFIDLQSLQDRLDELSIIKSRYILLPHVRSGGATTLLRASLLAHYRNMPCVGGYLDTGIDKLSEGDRNILDGKVEAYNYKAVGIFPTSDNRRRDFAQLGVNCAWVKWARPTAEALRQACLARKTRISHTKPELPALVIEALHVSLSKFMGPIDLELNPQFNCLIGGRGTGKSTILEYLRWGLCDQPPILADEDVADLHAKRNSLIANTLSVHKAVVTVVFTVNGVRHTVRRRSDAPELFLKVAGDEFRPVDEQSIRELLPLQAYSQKQLSAVGVRGDELLRFVQAPITRKLDDIRRNAEDDVATLRSAYLQLMRKRKFIAEIMRYEIVQGSLEKQLDA